MEPLNKKERTIAFLKFLGFFTVTVVLIVMAIFIDYQVPVKENKLLKAQYAQLEKELEFQSEFTRKIKEVQLILDSINNTNQNVLYLEQLASTKLAGMKESIPVTDSLQQKRMYDYVIKSLLSLQESKRNLRDFKESQTILVKYEENLHTYKEALEQAKRDLDICRQLSAR